MAGTARADSVSIDALTTSGQSDLVAGVPRIFHVSGTTADPEGLFIKYRPLGGPPCEATANADRGTWYREYYDVDSHGPNESYVPGEVWVDGAFDRRDVFTWNQAGTFVFCIYIAKGGGDITSAITQTLTFRKPSGTITATLNPAIPRPGQPTAVTVTGMAEAPENVYAKVRAAGGAPCAPTYDSDSGDSVVNGQEVDGTFSIPATVNRSVPGNYVLCLWLADAGDSTTMIAGPQPQPFSVVQPPPVVSSAQAFNCDTQRRITAFRARSVGSVCVRYTFSTPPLGGTTLTVSFVRPNGKTHSRVKGTWQENQSQPISLGSLPYRSYKQRRGTWKAVLRISGKVVRTTSFKVKR